MGKGDEAQYSCDACAMPSGDRIPIYVDTDSGSFSDDFWGLAFLLSDPTVDIKYVLVSGGDTSAKALIAAKVLDHFGRDDIPVGVGPATEESMYLAPDETGHLLPAYEPCDTCVPNPILREWGAGYDLDGYPGGVDFDGVAKLVTMIEAEAADESTPEPVLLVLGTADNVGHALDMDPDAFRGVKIVSMGGTLEGDKEFNYMLAPGPTQQMLAASSDVTRPPARRCLAGQRHRWTASTRAVGQRLRQTASTRAEEPRRCVTTDAAIPWSRSLLGAIGDRKSYDTYLRGETRIAFAMAQLQLALANYGTHREVADGMTDIRFDLVAAFVASGRGPDLYTTEVFENAAVTDQGKILPEPDDDEAAKFTIKVVSGWASAEAAEEFNEMVNAAIADPSTLA
mmetsp:Transcript_7652/g.22678  ORF Transcript_7652/g.22678 Transcript_7652/m.22678 type:complete len:397 (+) Transcript_7652:473-1663(+)